MMVKKLTKTKMGWNILPCEAKEIQKLIVEISEVVTVSEDESFVADSGEQFSKEEERVNRTSKVAIDKAANDNAVVGGVTHWHGAECVGVCY